MIEPPIHYTIQGSPHRWLVYRTEDQGGNRGTLCLFVADLPADQQHPFDVQSLFMNDPKISMAPRKDAIAVAESGVIAYVGLIDLHDAHGDLTGETDAVVEIVRPGDPRGHAHTSVKARVQASEKSAG